MRSLSAVIPFVLLSFSYIAQAVIVFPGNGVIPKAYVGSSPAKSEREFFISSAPGQIPTNSRNNGYPEDDKNVNIILSSHSSLNESQNQHPGSDSFVRGAIEAWAQHQHLVIRPDEVWFTILTQMNFYMNAHANDSEVRSVFVDHKGQEDILILSDFGWRDVLRRFKFAIQARVKTDWLLDWILPRFSTSTEEDEMTANVLMMGLMQAYFKFIGGITCGLPSVTLLGNVTDWERLAKKIERLPAFGKCFPKTDVPTLSGYNLFSCCYMNLSFRELWIIPWISHADGTNYLQGKSQKNTKPVFSP
jgi:hypothetical protein